MRSPPPLLSALSVEFRKSVSLGVSVLGLWGAQSQCQVGSRNFQTTQPLGFGTGSKTFDTWTA